MLNDEDWADIAHIAASKIGSDDYSSEEEGNPDPSLNGIDPDYTSQDGTQWSIVVVVRAVAHPIASANDSG